MKGQLLTTLSAAMLLGLAGCATTGGESPQSGDQIADASNRSETTYTLTGSRIRYHKDADERPELRAAYPLTVYSRQELEHTGQRDLGKALMLLYPPLNR